MLELRKSLILESKADIEKDTSDINANEVKLLYQQAKKLIPSIQKSFEETIEFHNQMIKEKIKYITKELPSIDKNLGVLSKELDSCITKEKEYTERLKEIEGIGEIDGIMLKIKESHVRKGELENTKNLLEKSQNVITKVSEKLKKINEAIDSKDDDVEKNISIFNNYFSDISENLYREKFIIALNKRDGIYELNVNSVTSSNVGTGKKKGQIAAFDLAYIKFADELNIKCPHFILHDQIEAIHNNQIKLIENIVSQINCQYIVPVLKDKLPNDLNVEKYKILSLSQDNKLFKIDEASSQI